MLVTITDLIILNQFLVRFTLYEFFNFVHDFDVTTDFLLRLFSGSWQLIATASIGSLMVLTILVRYAKCDAPSNPSPSLLVCVLAILFGTVFFRPMELHTPYLKSSIEAFFEPQTRNKAYSAGFKKLILRDPSRGSNCFAGIGARPNLILLVVESLSMYHSKLFSGIKDWTPEFDMLAKKGLRYTNFYANGTKTEHGLIALLIGEPPISKGAGYKSPLLDQFRSPKESIPRMLRDLGYHSVFLTTANLEFLGIGIWLEDIGFDYVEGHDSPYYYGKERFLFDAASDEALYGRAIQEIESLKRNKKTPFFMTLETVTTHHPHIDPISKTLSQELTFRYADKQIGLFAQNLAAAGFFENGYLLIISDHRAMLPMSAAEKDLYGDRAYTRIPFAVIGPGLNGEEDSAIFSQSDLLSSLRHWIDIKKHCINPYQGIFLPNAIRSPECVLTHRSYNVDNVYVHCEKKDYTINLNGDHTNYVGLQAGSLDLLKHLHRLRLYGP